MSPRIILVRHGRSAHIHTGWIDTAGVHRWREAYDAAGLAPGEAPPAALLALATEAGAVVASDLPRAVASAELLAPGAEIIISPLLRECMLPIPSLGRLRLPFAIWGIAIGLRWSYITARHGDLPSDERPRAAAAADWLIGVAAARGTVLAVTHGAFRPLLANALAARGWEREPKRGRFRHWSAWAFRRDGSAPR